MRIKLIAGLLLGFFVFMSIPTALAADVPMLTWELGKEQNVIIRGDGAPQSSNLEVVSTTEPTLKFHKSEKNSKGDLVYSVTIPESYAPGLYIVQSAATAKTEAKVIGGITVIPLQKANLVQIPIKLIILLLAHAFFISTLSSMRMQKYERIQYLRATPSAQLPNLIASLYRLRTMLVESIKRSLFKFLLIREGELLHKLSPAAWAITPILTFGLGCFATVKNPDSVGGSEHISATIFIIIAILGIFDSYSGFTAIFGFAFVQTVMGHVTSVQSSMVLAAIGLSWIAPGIAASLYQDILSKDKYFSAIKGFMPDVIASLLGGLLYLVSDYLMASLADNSGPIIGHGLFFPISVTIAIFIRINFERYILRDLHLTGENYQVRVLTMPRVVSPKAAALAAFYFSSTLYIWTNQLGFAIVNGALLALPLLLLVVRFDLPRINWIARFERNILLESTLVCVLAAIVMFKISNSPYDVIDKGKLLITDTAVALLVHGLISSVIDTCSRERVLA